MSRYADPTRCPDCASTIAYQASGCASCGLPLRGPIAQRLFETLSTADRLLVELRASALATTPATTGAPLPPPAPAGSTARIGLSAASVPKILLGLGATCVLVAALVFLAVTWTVMGVGGRTATLVVLTLVTGGLAAWMARRDLRGAAESLALVALGLLTLDMFGADNAGWLGRLDTEGFLVALGAVLGAAGVAGAVAARRTPIDGLVGAEAVAGIGVAVAALGLTDLDQGRSDLDLLLTVVLTAVTTIALKLASLRVGAVVSGVVAALAWLTLLGTGVDRALGDDSVRGLWLEGNAWPLLAAAVLAGALAPSGRLPTTLRVAAASTGAAVLAFALLVPALDEGRTPATLAVLAVLGAVAVLAWFAPRPWGLVAALPQVLGGLVVGAAVVELAAYGVSALGDIATASLGSPGGSHDVVLPDGTPAAWLLPLGLVALVGTVMAAAHASPEVDAVVGLVADVRALAAAAALTGVLTVSLYAPPVWLLVALLLATAVAFQLWWLRGGSLVPLAFGAGFLAVAVAVSLYDEWLTLGALAVALACSVHAHLATKHTSVSQVAGALAAATVAGLTWTVGILADADASVVALVGLALLAVVGTMSFLVPGGWWRSPSAVEARVGLEVGAAAAAIPLGLLGVLLAAPADQSSWAAGYLTLAGVAVTGTSLVRTDRRILGWPGGALLAAASWVRLWDIGVHEPEAYTLPSAVALSLVGLWQLRTRDDTGTVSALGPALALALVPSLLWVLVEPPGLRALLLGLGCLVLVFVGLRLHWTAPVVFGAVVGGTLVLRLAAPYLGDTVPRWVLIGAAGALLIAAGVTWERRLQEARQLRAYVRGMR